MVGAVFLCQRRDHARDLDHDHASILGHALVQVDNVGVEHANAP